MAMDGPPKDSERPRGPLHQHPRLGGDGQLWAPRSSRVLGDGSVHIPAFRHVYDPFASSEDEFLLGESFARLDLADDQEVQGWFVSHGALDRKGFWDDPRQGLTDRPSGPVTDTAADIAIEQARVRWLIDMLVRLNEHRLEHSWDETDDAQGLPAFWDDHPASADAWDTTTWAGAVALTVGLIAPYVEVAVRRRFGLELVEAETEHGQRMVLEPWEWRAWNSVLAPIYLQILEALRRITEGSAGTATCQQCGRPFLVLDGRRRRFCNARHRHRWTERQRRLRLKEERRLARLEATRQDAARTGRRAKR